LPVSFILRIQSTLIFMRIGFDAKRAYHNGTGLGHYSRTLIRSLAGNFKSHDYYLFNPKPSEIFNFNDLQNVHEVLPQSLPAKIFSSAWRSSWVKKDLIKHQVDLYHGLSHEIPLGVQNTGIKSVVTMHDLIHERYPDQYNIVDVKIYQKKFHYACVNSDKIIAISQQTKRDLIEFYGAPQNKIEVCYQSCNPAFGIEVSAAEKERVRAFYKLPEDFFLYVGSVIERKNLLAICKALFLLRHENTLPLVVIGDGGKYLQQVKDFILQHGLLQKVIFLSHQNEAKRSQAFKSAADFPAIYQLATAMIYPSFFEGFGIPVLEALFSRLPVITSNVSCLPEAGGNAAYYVDPNKAEDIAEGMKRICTDAVLAEGMKEKGWQHAQCFTTDKCAAAVMEVYQKIMS
jgi:Glycosyltransferase